MSPADHSRSRLPAILGAILLVGLLPATALAAGPTAVDDHVSVPVNALTTTVDVLANDLGPGNSVQAVTDPPHGTAAVASDKLSVTYKPDLGFHGIDTFGYTIKHGSATDDGVVTVDVNSPAVAVDDPGSACQTPGSFANAFPVTEDYAKPAPPPAGYFVWSGNCALLHNDVDVDGDPLTWQIVTPTAHGDLVKVDEQSFAYRPNANYSASDHGLPATDFDTFTYRVFDGYAYSAPATMRIWVAPVNDAPTFVPGPPAIVVGEDSGPYNAVWATGVSAGPASEAWQTVHFETETDLNGVPNLFSVAPAVDSSGHLTFTPAPDQAGLVHVTVRAKDDGGLEDWDATGQPSPADTSGDVTFDIAVVADAVSAVDDVATVPEDPDPGPWEIDVLGNDDFPAGATVSSVTQGTLGLVTIAPDGLSVSYQPDPDANGTDSFTYTLDDGAGSTDTARVDVTITPMNDDPVANDDSVTVALDDPATSVDVLANDTDVDGDQPIIVQTGLASKGTIAITGGGTGVTYQPNPNTTGIDSFSYTVGDGNGGFASGTVHVTITGNGVPTASDDELTVGEDDPATAVGVLANDTDPEGDPLLIVDTSPATKGTVTLTGGGTGLTYTPAPDANGSDSFTYTVNDGKGALATATVGVTITPVNDAPVTADDSVTVTFDGPAVPVDVLGNDTDVESDPLLITGVGTVPKGTVIITGGGTELTYQPSAGSNGSDTFSYTVSDGQGGTASGTVHVTITDNGIPTANDDTVTVQEDDPATAVAVLANDTDPEGDLLQVIASSTAGKGTVAITGGGTGLTYTPAPDANGSDSFTYTVNDGKGGLATGIVGVTITPTNDDPIAGTDALTVAEDATATSVDVLTNDTDVEGDTRTITGAASGAKGVVAVTGGGTGLTYKPNLNANGSDSFTYTISDGHGGIATGTVDVTINPVNDVPIALNDTTLAVQQGSGATNLAVLANDSDPDGDGLLITARTSGAHGTVTILGGGTGLSYDPAGLYFGTDVFTYTVSDGHGGTRSATVLLTVVKDTQKPVATAPLQVFYNGTSGATTANARITWGGSDTGGTGIGSFKLQVSVNGGAYSTVTLSSATATSSTRTLKVNSTYRFRALATDKGGNVGSYAYGPTFKVVRYQNTSSSVHYAGSWKTSSSTSALGGSHRYTSTAGASVTYTGSLRNVAWIATRTSTSGSAQVWVDGTLMATINLRSSSTGYKRLVYHRDFSTLGTHRIEIRSIGGGRVYFDALTILR
ncbi:MAG: Ig-like domain-containing protein [Chloroflexota bacterium]